MGITVLDQLIIVAGIVIVPLIGGFFVKYSKNMNDHFKVV